MTKENVFDNYGDRYEEWFEKNQHILDSEIEAIRQLLPDIGRGVEIGVGTGIFSARLGILHGIEPSAGMGLKATAKGIEVTQGVAEALPIAEQSYQFALMVTVDCFLQDIAQAFREVWRILSDDGCFIIAFIDRDTPLGVIYEQSKDNDEIYRHASFHSAAEITVFLLEAGFIIEEKRQTVFSFENIRHEVRDGTGDGVFAVIKAKKGYDDLSGL
ncbi:MAG: class I SAM-dependent DNA methyltransferase [Saccharofermentanales bacterium]